MFNHRQHHIESLKVGDVVGYAACFVRIANLDPATANRRGRIVRLHETGAHVVVKWEDSPDVPPSLIAACNVAKPFSAAFCEPSYFDPPKPRI